MPMASPVLTALIVTKLSARSFILPNADLTAFASDIASAVVEHVQTAATLVGVATGVVPGPATVPVTGTVL